MNEKAYRKQLEDQLKDEVHYTKEKAPKLYPEINESWRLPTREEYDDLVRDAKEKNDQIQICPVCNAKSFIQVSRSRIIKTFFFSGDIHIANTFQWVCHNPDCRYEKKRETELTEMGEYMKLPFWKRWFAKI